MLRHLFTSKHFRYGLFLTLVGALGIALFGVFRIAAFNYYGPITLPYTTPIDDISAILFFGSLPISEGIALYKWLRGETKPEDKQEPQKILVQETAPTVATLAEATIAPVAMPIAAVATPVATDLVFVDEEAILKFGGATSQLPPNQNEHLICRVMFQQPINKLVDWTVVYEEMTGNELNKVSRTDEYWKAWHSMYDAVKALDARVKQELGITLLMKWHDNTIKRTR